jgi:LacI family transcriptional regulator
LRTARTFTLGIAVPQLDNPVFTQMMIGATRAAQARGYELLITLVEDLSVGSGIYDRLANAHRVDGLLVSTLEPDEALRKALERVSVPYVVMNRKARGIENCVALDNFAAAKQSTEYLLSLGHRRIGHLAGLLNDYNGTRRLAGYRAALKGAGIEADPALVAEAGYTLEGGDRAARALLRVEPRPTAMLAATVLSAAGALRALHAERVRVPLEISVMSTNDLPIADTLHPPLTTLRMPLLEMGRVAADGLVDLLESKTASVTDTLHPNGVVVRESTAPPRAG